MPRLRCLCSTAFLVALTIVPPTSAQEPSEPPPPPPAAEEPAPTVVDPLTGERTAAAEPEVPEVELPPPGPDLTEAKALIRAGDLEAAEVALAGQQEAWPDHPRLLLLHGEVLLALTRPQDALPLLARSADLDATRPRVHFQLATALQATGDTDGALAAYLMEAEINEQTQVRIMARLNRMMLLEKSGDWSGAAGELEEVIVLDPAQIQAYGDLATLYLQAGKLDEAGATLQRGLEQGLRSARHYHTLGARYYDKKAYDAAIEAFRQAIEIDPTLADAERSLAGALDRADRPEEALAHFQRYLELKPDAQDADRVTQRMAAIRGD